MDGRFTATANGDEHQSERSIGGHVPGTRQTAADRRLVERRADH